MADEWRCERCPQRTVRRGRQGARAPDAGRRSRPAGQGERHVEALAAEDRPAQRRYLAPSPEPRHAAGLVDDPPDGTRIYYRLATTGRPVPGGPVTWRRRRHSELDHRLVRSPTSAGATSSNEITPRRISTPSRRRRRHRARRAASEPSTKPGTSAVRVVPIDELRRTLRELPVGPRDRRVLPRTVCVFADDAVRQLRRKGLRARRLRGRAARMAARRACPRGRDQRSDMNVLVILQGPAYGDERVLQRPAARGFARRTRRRRGAGLLLRRRRHVRDQRPDRSRRLLPPRPDDQLGRASRRGDRAVRHVHGRTRHHRRNG